MPFVHYKPAIVVALIFAVISTIMAATKSRMKKKINRLININYGGAHLIYLYFLFALSHSLRFFCFISIL